jgi:hypothetical protein
MTGILKVDTIQNANADNIITQTNSTTLTIGASGDTVTLAAGAISSGFSRTGTVNWDTTKKTTGFTAVNGVGYFCDTTSGAFTMTLPATPSAGDIVALKDYANTFDTNNLTIGRNGSNINGSANNAIINVQGQALTLIYIDATQGWSAIYGATDADLPVPRFVAATGGTITTCGNYKIHSFTGPGTFTVTDAGNPEGSTTVDYLVVAGGGGGGSYGAGGGGAGGYRESVPSPAAWTASPLASPGGALPVSVQGYPITVGAGSSGAGPGRASASNGSNSIFSTITSAGGGGGVGSITVGLSGGSGSGGSGGAGPGTSNPNAGGSGNTPPVSPSQGNNGGNGWDAQVLNTNGGGGGGAGAVGANSSSTVGGNGGNGVTSSINGTPTARAGGGGGGTDNGGPAGGTGGTGGSGGAGNGGNSPSNGTNANANSGSGGGGGGRTAPSSAIGGNGGSGIVVIRYKFQ